MRFAFRVAAASCVALLSLFPLNAASSCTFGLLSGVDTDAGTHSGDIAVGYFNADTYLDAAIVNRQSKNVTILLGAAGGTFTTGTTITLDGKTQNDIFAADINKDGKTDLAVAIGYDFPGFIQVLLGAGDGTFTKVAYSDQQYLSNPDRMATGDLNGDGKIDAVVTTSGANFSSMVNIGQFFAQKAQYSVLNPGESGITTDIALGDLDHDGKLDVIVAEEIYNRIVPYWGVGDGTFTKGNVITLTPAFNGHFINRLGAGDFNGDGYADVVIGWRDPYGTQNFPALAIMSSNGAGRSFGTPVTFTTMSGPEELTVFDINGDGKLDVLAAGDFGSNVYLGNGNGTMQSAIPLANDALGMAVGDFDRDGGPDIVTSRFSLGKMTLYLATCGRVTLDLTSSANPSNYSYPVTVTGTLTSPPAAAATGTITLSRDATTLGSQSLTSGTTLSDTAGALSVGTHSYTFDYSGDARYIASSKSLTQTVNPPPFGPPPGLNAFGTGGPVSLTWVATSGTDHYEIWRNSGSGFVAIGTSVAAAFTDNTPPATSALIYKVRAVSPSNVMSNFGVPDIASTYTFTDEPVAAGLTIKLVHLTQLRTAANAARVLAGLAPITWAESSPVIVKASHWTEVRNAIADARLQIGCNSYVYSEWVSAGQTIKATHVNETRAALR